MILPPFNSTRALEFADNNPPLPSLGQQIQEASVYLLAHPDYMLYTAITLAVLILAIAYIGDGLREALDPRALD